MLTRGGGGGGGVDVRVVGVDGGGGVLLWMGGVERCRLSTLKPYTIPVRFY